MVKSSAPVFVVLFAFLFKLEKPTLLMFMTISVICLGVVLMVASETTEITFDLGGYLMVQFAALSAGLRWTLTQVLLVQKSMGMTHPIVTTFYLAPVVSVFLFLSFVLVEGFGPLLQHPYMSSLGQGLQMFGIIGAGGVLAFFMSLAEFYLIYSTSVVTFTVAGIVKEIITIATAALIFKDQVTSGGKISGLIISILGIAMYNYIKIWHSDGPHRSPRGEEDLRPSPIGPNDEYIVLNDLE